MYAQDPKAMKAQKENHQAQKWMTPEDLDHFRRLLLAKRRQAEEEIEALRENIAEGAEADDADISSIAHHAGDMGTEVENTEMNYQLIDRELTYIEQIDDALERIDNGTYGICKATGLPISRGRLEAVPHTRYSINAKELGLVEDH